MSSAWMEIAAVRRSAVVVLVALGALTVTVGSASTSSNTVPNTTAGYGSSTVSGATVTSIDYNLSADGTQITSADLVLVGDLTGKTIAANFNGAALVTCTFGGYTPGAPGSSAATCSGFTQSTATATSFNVAVST